MCNTGWGKEVIQEPPVYGNISYCNGCLGNFCYQEQLIIMFIMMDFKMYKIIEPQPEIPITSPFYRFSSTHQKRGRLSLYLQQELRLLQQKYVCIYEVCPGSILEQGLAWLVVAVHHTGLVLGICLIPIRENGDSFLYMTWIHLVVRPWLRWGP